LKLLMTFFKVPESKPEAEDSAEPESLDVDFELLEVDLVLFEVVFALLEDVFVLLEEALAVLFFPVFLLVFLA